MFEYFKKKKNNIEILQKDPFTIFKIDNFLTDQEFNFFYKNFPKKDENLFRSADQRLSFDSEDNFQIYKKKYESDKIVRILHDNICNEIFFKYFLDKFKIDIIKSKLNFNDIFLMFKLLLKKNIENKIKPLKKNFLNRLFSINLKPSICYSYMENNTQLVPHTDTRRKIISLMLYFPDEELNGEQKKSLGTKFYNSNFKSKKNSGHQFH